MFDIGFLEILVILVIALLVIGPERMPEVARKLGSFMGKTKRFINSVKEEGELQDTVRELKESMDLQEEKKQLQELEQDLQQSLSHPAAEMDMDIESFKRPAFGGEEPPLDSPAQSQFSKAPSQPPLPQSETRHDAVHKPEDMSASSRAESDDTRKESEQAAKEAPQTESKS